MPSSDTEASVTERSTPKKPPCSFFLKTGSCAFGSRCKFQHPANQPPTQFNSLGLPLREGEPECPYYVENLHCGYGASCKFHHAEPVVGWVAMPSLVAQQPYSRPQLPAHPRPATATPDSSAYLAGQNQLAEQHQRMMASQHAIFSQNYQYSMAAMQQQPYLASQYGRGSQIPSMMPLGYHPPLPPMVLPNHPQPMHPAAGSLQWPPPHQPAYPVRVSTGPAVQHQPVDDRTMRAPARIWRGGNFGEGADSRPRQQ